MGMLHADLTTTILIPLDGSLRAAQAIPVAGRLARRLGLPIKFVTVIDPKRSFPPAFSYDAAQTGVYFEELLAGMRHELAFMLNRAVKTMRRSGVEADSNLHRLEDFVDEFKWRIAIRGAVVDAVQFGNADQALEGGEDK